jgi:hypothetical protein
MKDGILIAHATNSTLTATNAQFSDEGDYSVIVSNPNGSVTSSRARLTILVRPAIVVHPLEQRLAEGGEATFSVSVSGSLPLTYTWRRDGAPQTNMVLNDRTSFLKLRDVSTNQAGGWRVIVSNAAGSPVQSNNANLVVLRDEDGDGAPDAWEVQNGFDPSMPNDAGLDFDEDGLSNADEFRAGTDPRQAGSTVRLSALRDQAGVARVAFSASSNRTYAVEERPLAEIEWRTTIEVVAVSSNRHMEIAVSNSPGALYRLRTPR